MGVDAHHSAGLFGGFCRRVGLLALCHCQLQQLAWQNNSVVQTDKGRSQEQGHVVNMASFFYR